LRDGMGGVRSSRGGADPSGLLNDFLRLVPKERALPGDKEQARRQREAEEAKTIDQVVTFVKTWGPLWLCRTLKHFGHKRTCFWEPQQSVYWGGTASLCSWSPVEEVYAFIREAQQAEKTVEAISELRRGNLDEKAQLELKDKIENRLARHGHLQVEVNWSAHRTQPKWLLLSKIGFIHTVWMEIFQLLCNVKALFQCDGCGYPYVRESRKPKAGQHQYCPTCGVRAAQRDHARRKRARHTP